MRKEGGGWFVFEVSEKTPDLRSDLLDIRFVLYFEILRFTANHEELSRAREGALIQAKYSPTLARKRKAVTPKPRVDARSQILLMPCVPRLHRTTGRLILLQR